MASPHPLSPLLLALCLALPIAGCLDSEDGGDEPVFPEPADADVLAWMEHLRGDPELRFDTDHGTIRMLLYSGFMPTTSAHIGGLAARGFYDDTIIHRVVDDFVIQGGDPSGTGQLGSGQTIAFERHPELLFGAGAVGLARDTDPDSGDSQWFITEKPAPHLSDSSRSRAGSVFGEFTLFAQVVSGMDVVRKIAAVPVLPGLDRPVEDVVLQDAELLAPPSDIDLLQYPQTIRLHDDDPRPWVLQRPHFLLEGHPFDVLLFFSGDSPPDTPSLTYQHDEHVEEVALTALPDDPFVFQGRVTLGANGTWSEAVRVAGTSATTDVPVVPWNDEFVRYTAGGRSSE